jgi:seryl-tRNA synthetase
MLDIRFIRENVELFRKTAMDKRMSFDLDELIAVDEKRRELIEILHPLKAELKQGNSLISKLAKEERQEHIAGMKQISEKIKSIEEESREVQKRFDELMLKVPSPMAPGVPVGKDDTENVELRCAGQVPDFSFTPKDHAELGSELDIIDIERGVKISGSRFYFLKNAGALLENAVMRYALDFIVKRGFTPMTVPLLVREPAMTGTGYFPGGEEQAYAIEKDELYLIGTSEVPLASYHYDEILKEEEFPIRLAGWSNCFRREAGTYGKDTRGLYRIHQFQKVEQVYILENDEAKSREALDYLLKNATDFLESLNIPYQVVLVCSGDMGQGQVMKYDINSWMPSRNAYCETHSCSMFYEFQARRLKMRYKDGDGNTKYCHTLNNTLIASPRILIPLLELNQRSDGSVAIPEVLQPYMNGLTEIKK